MSKLLFNTRPLVIDPELAALLGLNESIILQQIHYWVELNRKAEKNFHEEFYWTYNTYEAWQEQFPFWHIDTIRRTIARLESKKLLITDNFNKAKFDRTKWYRIDYEALESEQNHPLVQNAQMDKGNLHSPIPETIQRGHFEGTEEGSPGPEYTDHRILMAVADLAQPKAFKFGRLPKRSERKGKWK
jgi:hypothetical protein